MSSCLVDCLVFVVSFSLRVCIVSAIAKQSARETALKDTLSELRRSSQQGGDVIDNFLVFLCYSVVVFLVLFSIVVAFVQFM